MTAYSPSTASLSPLPSESPRAMIRPLSDVEREAIEAAITACGGSIHRAAELLGVAPSTLYRKRQTWVRMG